MFHIYKQYNIFKWYKELFTIIIRMDYENYEYPGTNYTLMKILEKDITKQIKNFVLSFWTEKKKDSQLLNQFL